jgi:hypothetical protein
MITDTGDWAWGWTPMELREALTQITEIRLQLARTEVFRGYRAMPVAFSGVVALLAGLIQAATIADPMTQVGAYLSLWIGAAVISGLAAGLEMMVRARNASSRLTRELTWLALEQFCPSLVAGALLTIVLVRAVPESLWMLPGLWQIFYSLGIFASCRLLPRPTFWVAVFYLGTGLAVLAVPNGEASLSPWMMGVPFGVGQLLAAAILYRTLERDLGSA